MSLADSQIEGRDLPPGDITDDSSGGGQAVAGLSPTQLALRRFRKDRLSMISFWIVVLYFLIAVMSPLLAKFGIFDGYGFHQNLLNVNEGGLPRHAWGGISWSHPLGVEPGTGRDVLSRLMLGITSSLTIAISATVLTIAFGAVLGIVAGYSGGWVDSVVGRVVDLTLSFPSTLVLLALSGTAVLVIQKYLHIGNPDIANGLYVVVVLAAFGWPPICRVVRGQVLSLREREFIEAATLIGASRARIYFKEILPNLWAPLLVYFSLTMPAYISAEAALNYLGVGIKPPTPTMGNILAYSISFSVSDPFFFFVPALTLALIVVCFNLLGDGLRDALDPKSTR
ncbi:MAG: binding-protein-dependent transport system inner rane component [Marmoricola sp.]|nr:binding-protein-dependent transport system inner rane component [Marmoricola sp.]